MLSCCVSNLALSKLCIVHCDFHCNCHLSPRLLVANFCLVQMDVLLTGVGLLCLSMMTCLLIATADPFVTCVCDFELQAAVGCALDRSRSCVMQLSHESATPSYMQQLAVLLTAAGRL
jgi:hypothetical protein